MMFEDWRRWGVTMDHCASRVCNERRGAAAVEFALLSPLLLFLFVIVLDFGRIFFYSQTVENAARAGALYMSDDATIASSPYANVTQAALADASNLSPAPTVSSSSGNDADGHPYVRVTVTWTFRMVTRLPGVPATLNLSRTVQMRKVSG
jgi:Flp pilus assembly protein TadG